MIFEYLQSICLRLCIMWMIWHWHLLSISKFERKINISFVFFLRWFVSLLLFIFSLTLVGANIISYDGMGSTETIGLQLTQSKHTILKLLNMNIWEHFCCCSIIQFLFCFFLFRFYLLVFGHTIMMKWERWRAAKDKKK